MDGNRDEDGVPLAFSMSQVNGGEKEQGGIISCDAMRHILLECCAMSWYLIMTSK